MPLSCLFNIVKNLSYNAFFCIQVFKNFLLAMDKVSFKADQASFHKQALIKIIIFLTVDDQPDIKHSLKWGFIKENHLIFTEYNFYFFYNFHENFICINKLV